MNLNLHLETSISKIKDEKNKKCPKKNVLDMFNTKRTTGLAIITYLGDSI